MLHEETGYFSFVNALIGLYSSSRKDSLVLLFEVELLERQNWEPNEEIAEVGFFAKDSLPLLINQRIIVRLQDAFNGERGVLQTFLSEDRVEHHYTYYSDKDE